jgi:hypothetical protein
MDKFILSIKQVLGAAGLSAALMTMVVYTSKSQPIPEFDAWALRPSLVPDFALVPVEAGNGRDTRPHDPADAAHLHRRSSHGFCSVGPANRRRGYARVHLSCKRLKIQQEWSTAIGKLPRSRQKPPSRQGTLRKSLPLYNGFRTLTETGSP